MTFGARWTPHEIQTIEALRAKGVDFPTIAAEIGRDPKSCADRLSAWRRQQGKSTKPEQWSPEEDARFLALCEASPGRKNWKEIASIMGRSTGACYKRYSERNKKSRESLEHRVPAVVVNPDAILEARARYAARLRQDPCASLLGDPPPGYSALDTRRQQCSSSSSGCPSLASSTHGPSQ